jgi:hypothetical protein
MLALFWMGNNQQRVYAHFELMKTPNRNFVVEYKGTRKRSPSEPKSIWGDIDLRSAAKSVEEDGLLPTEKPPMQTTDITEVASHPIVVEAATNASGFEDPTVVEATDRLVTAEETVQAQPSVSSEAHALERPEADQIVARPRKARGKDLKSRRRRAQVAASTEVPSDPMVDMPWEDELAQLDAENLRLKRELSDKLRDENEALVAMLQRLRDT